MDRLKTMKVLIIDDDYPIRKAMTYFFKDKTRQFKAVGTAERGLVALKEESWDIIISDYELPGMNGIDFLRLVHQEGTDAIRIIFTGYGGSELKDQASHEGIDAVIQKPFDTETLLKTLDFLIRKPLAEDQVTRTPTPENEALG